MSRLDMSDSGERAVAHDPREVILQGVATFLLGGASAASRDADRDARRGSVVAAAALVFAALGFVLGPSFRAGGGAAVDVAGDPSVPPLLLGHAGAACGEPFDAPAAMSSVESRRLHRRAS